MAEESLVEKAKSLCKGESVCVSGLVVRAKQVCEEELACNNCEMGSACDYEMSSQCAMCDAISGHVYRLYIPIWG